MVQRHVLCLGEINDSERAAWTRAIEIFDDGGGAKQIAVFPVDRITPALACDVVSIRLAGMRLRRPRQWGACWLAMLLWGQLRLNDFYRPFLPLSREGTDWPQDADRLSADRSRQRMAASPPLFRAERGGRSARRGCRARSAQYALPLPRLAPRPQAQPFTHLARALERTCLRPTSKCCFTISPAPISNAIPPEAGKRKHGHSRDKRPDCVQVVIALVITTDGFPLAYEVMDGNTSDRTTLKAFLSKIEAQYGRAKRTRVMDRGIPTEGDLAESAPRRRQSAISWARRAAG